MDEVLERVDHEGERREERKEREDDGVEQPLRSHDVRELGVQPHETKGQREVEPGLQKRDDLGATSWGGDHEDVLGVPENGVVEQNAEEHERKGNELAEGDHGHAEDLLLLGLVRSGSLHDGVLVSSRPKLPPPHLRDPGLLNPLGSGPGAARGHMLPPVQPHLVHHLARAHSLPRHHRGGLPHGLHRCRVHLAACASQASRSLQY